MILVLTRLSIGISSKKIFVCAETYCHGVSCWRLSVNVMSDAAVCANDPVDLRSRLFGP